MTRVVPPPIERPMAMELNGTTDAQIWGEFLWVRRLGYLRISDVVRVMMLVYIVLTAIVTVVTTDLVTLGFLVLLAIPVLRKGWFVRFFPKSRLITVYTNEGMYVAKHKESGLTRHGETPEDALTNVTGVIASPGVRASVD